MEPSVISKKIVPPIALVPNLVVFNRSKSSLYSGKSPTNKTPDTWIAVVKHVNLIKPCNFPFSRAVLETSQIPKSIVENAPAKFPALLLTVVNMA